VAGAAKRPLGDSWAWARRGLSVDISPLVAVSLARWGYATRAHLHNREPSITSDRATTPEAFSVASEIVAGTGRLGQLDPRADGQPGWLDGERRQRPPSY
jgi:hypothetical protein